MRTFLIAAVAALSLAACSQQQIKTACTTDAVYGPGLVAGAAGVAAASDPAAAPAAGAVVAGDQVALHPAIQAECAQLLAPKPAAAATAPAQPAATAPAAQ